MAKKSKTKKTNKKTPKFTGQLPPGIIPLPTKFWSNKKKQILGGKINCFKLHIR